MEWIRSIKNKPLSKDCLNLIQGLLDVNPLTRFKLRDVFAHPFITSHSQNQELKTNSIRKESLDDSYENTSKFGNKNLKVCENIKKKFGFEKTLSLRNEISSKQLNFFDIPSENNIISVKTFDYKRIEKKESKRLEKLIDNMSNEFKKDKKKFFDLNFKQNKQFSFEDFRDSEILFEDKKIDENLDDSNYKETINTSNYEIKNEEEKN